MMKAFKFEHALQPPIGDFVDPEMGFYLRPVDKLLDNNFIPLEFFSLNPWDAAWKAGIDILNLRKQHDCPYSMNKWMELVPLGIMTTNPGGYADQLPAHIRQMALDKRWTDQYFKNDLSAIEAAVLGTGYSVGRSPYDGYSEATFFVITLDNEDMVLVAAHIWFNK